MNYSPFFVFSLCLIVLLVDLPTATTQHAVAERLGQCPRRTGAGPCVEDCSSDADCDQPGQRCCSNGCGHSCQNTRGFRLEKLVERSSKPGECPQVLPGTIGTCIEACTSDAACPPRQKCCSNGCGHTCQTPVRKRRATREACPDEPCNIRCAYGLKYTKKGCQLCECYDPCVNYMCPSGQICKPVMIQCFVAPCIPPSVPSCVDAVQA